MTMLQSMKAPLYMQYSGGRSLMDYVNTQQAQFLP